MASPDFENSNEETLNFEKDSLSRKRKSLDSADLSHDDESSGSKKQNVEGLGKVVATHYNKLPEKGLQERNMSRIVYMRNFNNWIKSIILSKQLNQIKDQSPDDHKIIALDMGCGKGGDLLKWQKANIRHLICVDIASTSISQCKERYESSRQRGKIFSSEFLVADCTKTRFQKHIQFPEKKVDLVSCQFAFHYCFETLEQAETMVRNVSDVLRKGAYFVATIPDANKITSCLAASDSNSFGNEVFRIEFPEDRSSPPPLFGDTYNFFLEGVVNCPEFLVHFPTLIRICKKYDLELVYKKSFEELYKEGINDRDSKSLLFRMKALEMYPSMHGCSLSSSSEEEYVHAEDYLKETNSRSLKTISKSEWEAVSLYLAFAFKKVR